MKILYKLIITLAYYFVDYLLKKHTVNQTIDIVNKNKIRPFKNTDKYIEALEETAYKFEKKDMVCLHKALATFLLIKNKEQLTFNIGLSKYNFESHSWITENGLVITDNHEYVKDKYIVIKEVHH
ncbi:lasso peptide biosynthesis protein [Mammaliicoccus sciuri]|uniref:lasso peptide biosynthesis protein n=1 Tax=Mammaliicoccus sciuri TaxID=1296 RepID=UPI0034DD6224